MGLQRIYSGRGLMDAHFVRSLLDGQGIRASVMGETLPEVVGAMPLGTLPSVWVEAEDFERAMGVMAEFEEAPAGQQADTMPWRCPGCGEAIEGQFGLCWYCQTPRPGEGETAEAPAGVPGDMTLRGDLSCTRCQYNLRGLTPQGRCPECGSPILRSLLEALRNGTSTDTEEAERAMRRPFETLWQKIGYPADALIMVCHAWMNATQPLNSGQPAPADAVTAAGWTCVAMRDEAIFRCGSAREAKATLRIWAIHGSDEIGQIVSGLMEAGLIQRTGDDPAETFKGLFSLDGLFLLGE